MRRRNMWSLKSKTFREPICELSDFEAGRVQRIVAEQDKAREAEQKLNQALE